MNSDHDNQLAKYLRQIVRPSQDSHKGENGRVLVIGGSKLFHAAAFWSASAASKIVDLVHFSSPALENNELMRARAKAKFWDGIVVPWDEVEHYIAEDDAILIGPGMPRDEGLMAGERRTAEIVNSLLAKYPEKRWVVDGGALQEVDVSLLGNTMIVTPNARELTVLYTETQTKELNDLAQAQKGVTILAKGPVDMVTNGTEYIEIVGGNAGMTKGGTGDVLSGIVAGLYAKSPAMASAVVASQANKLAGERLSKTSEAFYSASDLLPLIRAELAGLVRAQ